LKPKHRPQNIFQAQKCHVMAISVKRADYFEWKFQGLVLRTWTFQQCGMSARHDANNSHCVAD